MKIPRWLKIAVPTVVIGLWLGAGAIGGPYFGRIEEVSDIDLAAFLPESAEATKVNNEAKRFRSDSTLPAIVVFEDKNGTIDEADTATLTQAKEAIKNTPGVKGDVSELVISKDEKAAFLIAPIDSKVNVADTVNDIRGNLDSEKLAGIRYKISGPAGFSSDLNKAFAGIDGILLLTALAVVFVILIVVYRSVILPVVVLMTSIFALSASILLVWWLARYNLVQLNGQVQGILFILVIGAATDYSLLYVSRYREELYTTSSKLEATMKAWKGSVEPIVASGGTVIAGLLCLLLSELGSNKALGPVGSLGILFAMLAALSFLPTVLYVFGRASFWPARPVATDEARTQHQQKLERGFWHKVGTLVSRRPRTVWAVTLGLLVGAAAFAPQIKAEGVAQSDLIVGQSEARDGQEVLNKYFPDGSGSPALIIVREENMDRVVAVVDALPGVAGVSAVATGTEAGFKPLGKQEDDIKNEIRKKVETEFALKQRELDESLAAIENQAGPEAAEQVRQQALANIPSIDSVVAEAYPFENASIRTENGEVLLQATLTDAPDSEAAKSTVAALRREVKGVDDSGKVGGVTAVQVDTNAASIRDRTLIIPMVLAAITLILMVLLRSVAAPILLLLTTILSFASSLGVAAILFNNVLNFPGADPSVILYAFVFLVALGIDYNIFLMTRVREETVKSGTGAGVIKGLVVTGGVITSAGIVLAATFAALSVIPILFLFQLAFIVSFGVLLDTFIVRSLLVPALIKDIGPIVWWPSKLRHKP